jgi:hypothetical protein
MPDYRLGEMVKVKVKFFSDKGDHDGYRLIYGMITQIRNKSEIAYIDFLPIEDMANQWVSFTSMVKKV